MPPQLGQLPSWFSAAAIWVAFLSCALNPLVYVFRNSGIRREIRQMCRKQDKWTPGGSATNYAANGHDLSRRSSAAAQNGRLVLCPNQSYPQIASLLGNGEAPISRSNSVVTFNTAHIDIRKTPVLRL